MRFSLPKIKVKQYIHRLSYKLRGDRAILIVCIGIALMFWVLTKMSQTYRTEREVKFDLSIASEKTFYESPPDNLIAVIEGYGWDLMADYFNKPYVTLEYDLRQYERLDLNRAQLRTAIDKELLSKDIRVVDLLNHDEIHLQLEEKLQKTIPVKWPGSVKTEKEYQLKRPPYLKPDSIQLVGPAPKVVGIEHWPTDTLIVQGLKTDEAIDLKLAEPSLEFRLSQRKVQLILEVEQITEKSFFIPVQIINDLGNVNIFPNKIRLTCLVGLSRYESLSAEDFTLLVDFKDISLEESKNTMPINLVQSPKYVSNIQYSPPAVEYYIVQEDPDSTQVKKSGL